MSPENRPKPNRKGLSSNHHFSGAKNVKLREGNDEIVQQRQILGQSLDYEVGFFAFWDVRIDVFFADPSRLNCLEKDMTTVLPRSLT